MKGWKIRKTGKKKQETYGIWGPPLIPGGGGPPRIPGGGGGPGPPLIPGGGGPPRGSAAVVGASSPGGRGLSPVIGGGPPRGRGTIGVTPPTLAFFEVNKQ